MSGLGDLQGSNAQTPRASAAFFSSPFQALSSLPLLLAAAWKALSAAEEEQLLSDLTMLG